MESVAVLQQQAQALQRRMQLTEMVHAAKLVLYLFRVSNTGWQKILKNLTSF